MREQGKVGGSREDAGAGAGGEEESVEKEPDRVQGRCGGGEGKRRTGAVTEKEHCL